MNQQLLFAIQLFTLASGYLFTRSRTRAIKYRIREKSIPDVAVLFLLENLKRLILHHARLIRDAENQIEMLDNDVLLLKAFLKDASRRRYTNKVLEDFIGQIKSVVSGAESVMGVYAIQMRRNKEMNFFQKAFGGSMQLIAVAKEVQKIRAKVNGIFGKSRTVFATRPAAGVEEEEMPKEEKKVLVSQDNKLDLCEPRSVICDLSRKSDDLDIITIIRMPGPGKTTTGGITIQEWGKNCPLAIGYLFDNNRS